MALFEKGLSQNTYTFMINDEFQNTINVSASNRFSDTELFSVSREFRNINVITTQSVASMYAKGNPHSVASLLANCTNKILLQTRDPQTIKWAEEFLDYQLPSIGELRRGECLVDMTNAQGEVVSEQDRVQNAYQDMCDLLDEPAPLKADNAPRRKALPKSATGFPLEVEAVLAQNCADDERIQLRMLAQLTAMRQASAQGKDYGTEGQLSRESLQMKPRKQDREELRFRREFRDVIETLPTGAEGAKVFKTMFDIWKDEKNFRCKEVK